MSENSFWGRTKPLIKAHNMTQDLFARKMGFSVNTFKNWIYYDRIPDLSAAYDIAKVLGVTLDYLIGGKDKEMAEMRFKEIELRKTAAEILKLTENIQEQLMQMKPLDRE